MESKQAAREYSDEMFLRAVRAGVVDKTAPTTATIARRVGCSRTTAARRLAALADAGRVARHECVGLVMWSRPEDTLAGALRR